MVSKKEKQNPPPPQPEEVASEEDEEVEDEEEGDEEEEEEEEVEEKEVEEEGHQEKPQPSSSEDESGSDEDDDQSTSHPPQPSVKNPSVQRQPTPPPAVVPNSGSEEEETESDEEEADLASESPRSATASAYTVKPITTVPASSKVSKPTPKRPLESSKNEVKGSTDGKKAKTVEENDKKGKSAVPPGRIWSEDSEIVVLQGLINYQKQKGPFRTGDTAVFHEFIKGKLWDGVTKTQIADKLKRLKSKYFANVKKGKNGQDPPFPKPHEKKAYDLSKQIWGGGGESNGIEEKANTKADNGKGKKVSNAGSETKRVEDNSNSKVKSDNPKGKKGSNDGSALMDVDEDAKQDLGKDELKDDDEEDFLSKFPTLSNSFDAEVGHLKGKIHLIGSQKARELEEKWKQVQLEETDLFLKKLNLKSEQVKLVSDAMKKQ